MKKKPWNKGKKGVYKASEKTKKRISRSLKKAYRDPKLRKKLSDARKGHKVAKKTRRKIGIKNKENTKRYWKNASLEEIAERWTKPGWFKPDQIMPMQGRKHAPESRKKMSESHKGVPLSEKHRKALRDRIPWNKGKKGIPEETRRKMSLARKGKPPANKGKKLTPKERLMISEKIKEVYAKGHKPWNKDKTGHLSEETLEKLRENRAKQKFKRKETGPEKSLQKLCKNVGIQFVKQKNFNLGFQWHAVDIFIEPNICLEVDGDYDHANPHPFLIPSRSSKIQPGFKPEQIIHTSKHKITRAKDRRQLDKKITQALEQQGNHVLRFWQSKLETEPEKCLQKIITVIKESKPKK